MAELRLNCDVSPELARELERLVRGQHSLHEVIRWGLAQTPPILVSDVVVQDEYTHDVVLRHASGAYLVYDST